MKTAEQVAEAEWYLAIACQHHGTGARPEERKWQTIAIAHVRTVLGELADLRAKLAEAERTHEARRKTLKWADERLQVLERKLAEAESSCISEEEMRLLIRRVMADYRYRDQEEASRHQFPRAELLGVEWFRELMAAKPTAPTQSTLDAETVDAIAVAALEADRSIRGCLGEDPMHSSLDAARAEAEKRRGEQHGTWVPFEVGDHVALQMPGQLVKPGTISAIALRTQLDEDMEDEWYEVSGAVLLPPPPAEPEPKTCKCGACVRGRPIGWQEKGGYAWLVRLWAQSWTQPDGTVCPNPDCGEKLEAPDAAADSQ